MDVFVFIDDVSEAADTDTAFIDTNKLLERRKDITATIPTKVINQFIDEV